MKTTSSPNLSLPYRKTSQKNLWQQSYTQHLCLLLPLLFPPMVPSSLSPSGLGLSNPCPSFSTLASSLGVLSFSPFQYFLLPTFLFLFVVGFVGGLSPKCSIFPQIDKPYFFWGIYFHSCLFVSKVNIFPYCSIPYSPAPLPFLPLLLDFNVISFAPPLVVFFFSLSLTTFCLIRAQTFLHPIKFSIHKHLS